MKIVNSILLAVTVNASANENSHEQVFPSGYHGIWDHSLEQCAKDYSTARITIEKNAISYWESYGQISRVIDKSASSLKVKLSMSGEGEEWYVVSDFRLNGDKLTEHFDEGGSYTRVRCTTGI